MSALLKVQGLEKHFESFSLGPIDLEIEPGETVGLVGTNGAGKTTMIKCLLGLMQADAGSIQVFGESVSQGATGEMRQDIGVVMDSCKLHRDLRASDVAFVMRTAYRSWDDAAYRRYLKMLGLPDFAKVGKLSRGMGMKLSLACALAHKPRLLILDEATAGLDPMVRESVLDLLRSYLMEHDAGMLMCTHVTTDLERVADRVICLDAGRLVFAKDRDELVDLAGLARCRSVDLEALKEDGYLADQDLRFERDTYGITVLVPDRFEFLRRYEGIPCDRCTIEDYMRIMLKGEIR